MTREFFELLAVAVSALALAWLVLDTVIGWIWWHAEGYLLRRRARRVLADIARDRTWRHVDRP